MGPAPSMRGSVMFDNIIKFPHDASRRTVTQRRRASSNGFSSFSNDAAEKIREMAMQILLGHVGTGSQTPSISGYPFASFGIAAAPWGRDAVRPRSHLSMMGHPSAFLHPTMSIKPSPVAKREGRRSR